MIPFHRVVERVAEWGKPWLELSPLVEALAINRPPDLLGAGRADATFGFVIFDATGFERQAAEVEDTANASFEIRNDVLMPDPQHSGSRQYGVPMFHNIEICSIVAGNVIDAVGKLLSLRKELLQIAEAAGHRFHVAHR